MVLRHLIFLALFCHSFGALVDFNSCLEEGGVLLTEKICLPKNYSVTTKPSKVTKITANLTLAHVKELNVEDQVLHTFVVLRLAWQEPRLVIKEPLTDFETSNSMYAEHVWKPYHYIEDLVSLKGNSKWNVSCNGRLDYLLTEIKSVGSHKSEMFIGPQDNIPSIWVQTRVIVKTTCKLDLERFPFDVQQCDFLMLPIYPIDELEYVSNVELNAKEHFLKEFDVDIQPQNLNKTWAPEGGAKSGDENDVYNNFGFRVTLYRVAWPYIWNHFIPVSAMVLVASTSFWIPAEAVPGRIALLVTLSLVMINIFESVQVGQWSSMS